MVLLVELLKFRLRVLVHDCNGAWLQPLTGASIWVQASLAVGGHSIQGVSFCDSFCTKGAMLVTYFFNVHATHCGLAAEATAECISSTQFACHALAAAIAQSVVYWCLANKQHEV